jgi:hypothetical protein
LRSCVVLKSRRLPFNAISVHILLGGDGGNPFPVKAHIIIIPALNLGVNHSAGRGSRPMFAQREGGLSLYGHALFFIIP